MPGGNRSKYLYSIIYVHVQSRFPALLTQVIGHFRRRSGARGILKNDYLCGNNIPMKRLLPILLLLVLLPSCHKAIWEKLNDHEERISRLETFCNQLNTNINSLQAIVNALNARDYVKDVVPVTENGTVIGYTITFNGSNPVTIYNGKNGEDAHTPLIGIRQDTDGIWYWTLDGEWILDADGLKVRADGRGADGITPLLKIEEGYWFVSYDKGVSWTQMGVAVGEPGANGDSMFRDVWQDSGHVYLVLADGETITLPKGGLSWVYV